MRRFREQEEEEDAKRGGVPSLPESRQWKRGEQKRGEQKRGEQRQDDQQEDNQPQDDQSPDEWRRGEQEREEQQREEDEEERGTQRYKTVVPGRDRPDYAAYGRRRAQPRKDEREQKAGTSKKRGDFVWDAANAEYIFNISIDPFIEAGKAAQACYNNGPGEGQAPYLLYENYAGICIHVISNLAETYFSSAGGDTSVVTLNLHQSFLAYIQKFLFTVRDAERGRRASEPEAPAEPPAAGGLVVFDGGTPSKKGRTFWQKLRGAGKALKRAFGTGSGTGLHSKTRTQATPEALTRRAARRLERLGYTYKASEDGGVSASAWPPPTRAGGTTSC